MTDQPQNGVRITQDGFLGFVELCRPPNNFFDVTMLGAIADALDAFAVGGRTRAVVLSSVGKHFCAGADLAAAGPHADARAIGEVLYAAAIRIVCAPLPVVAAVHGAAIGGGLGLALAADLRVCGPSARFSANFSRLGYHPGFGISVTLPRLIGAHRAADLLLSGRTVRAEDAVGIGLVDRLVADGDEREAATELAGQLAEAAPLAVRSIRTTLRADLVAALRPAISHELDEQSWLMATADWREGIRASRDHRSPVFRGE